MPGERAVDARLEQVDEVVLEARDVHLRLGVAETGVELEHLRAVIGEHDARVKHAAKVDAFCGATGEPRVEHGVGDLGEFFVAQKRHRRVGAHAAGVQAFVAVEGAFVILRAGEKLGAFAIAQCVQRHLHAGDQFLDQHARAGLAERAVGHDLVDCPVGFTGVVADEHALAEREPVRLHRALAVERRGERLGSVRIGERRRLHRRDAVAIHEFLRENFGRFKLRRLLCWPPGAETGGLELIDDAHCEWVVRADDGEVGLVVAGEREQCRQILRADADALDRRAVGRERLAADTGIAGGAPHLLGTGGLCQFPNQGVFAAASADHQNLHQALRRRIVNQPRRRESIFPRGALG